MSTDIRVGPFNLISRMRAGVVKGMRVETHSHRHENLVVGDIQKDNSYVYTSFSTSEEVCIDLANADGNLFTLSVNAAWKTMKVNPGAHIIMAELSDTKVGTLIHYPVMLYDVTTNQFWTDDNALAAHVTDFNQSGVIISSIIWALLIFLTPIILFNIHPVETGLLAVIVFFIVRARKRSANVRQQKAYSHELSQKLKEILRNAAKGLSPLS